MSRPLAYSLASQGDPAGGADVVQCSNASYCCLADGGGFGCCSISASVLGLGAYSTLGIINANGFSAIATSTSSSSPPSTTAASTSEPTITSTSGPTSTPLAANQPDHSDSSGSKVGAIAGGSVGGILIILVIIAFLMYRHRKRGRAKGTALPREKRLQESKAELADEGLLELEATKEALVELEPAGMAPTELETVERSQELQSMMDHSG